jgi:hypothetical protein
MPTTGPINALVLQEFRLHAADSAGEAARIVAAFSDGIEPPVPLLTSIDDDCDVAIVRGLHAGEQPEADPRQRAALDPFVSSWQPVKQYGPRIAERSASPPTHYRLAVTESGITNTKPEPSEPSEPSETPPRNVADRNTSKRVGLLWIGLPVGTYAGLMTLLGTDGGGRSEPREWLPLSRSLGVRIYESQR